MRQRTPPSLQSNPPLDRHAFLVQEPRDRLHGRPFLPFEALTRSCHLSLPGTVGFAPDHFIEMVQRSSPESPYALTYGRLQPGRGGVRVNQNGNECLRHTEAGAPAIDA